MISGEVIQRLLTKYKYTGTIPPEIQAQIPRLKKETLRVILKSQLRESVFLTPGLRFFSIMRKSGINLSLTSSVSSLRAAVYSAAVVIAVCTAFLINNVMMQRESSSLSVIYASGDVSIKKNDGTFSPLLNGDSIAAGTSVITKEKSRAIIIIDKTTAISLEENTEFELKTALRTRQNFVLLKGAVTASVGKRNSGSELSIETGNFAAVVHGTIFRVTSSGGVTSLSLLNGIVSMKPKIDGIIQDGKESIIKENTTAGIKNNLIQDAPLSEEELKLFYESIGEVISAVKNNKKDGVMDKSLYDQLLQIESAGDKSSLENKTEKSENGSSSVRKSPSEIKSDKAEDPVKEVLPLTPDKNDGGSVEEKKDLEKKEIKKKKAGNAIIF